MKRQLTPTEKVIVERFARQLPENQCRQLLEDLDRSVVEDATDDESRLIFHINDYQRPPYRGQHAFPVEGRANDSDGASLTILLHADENDRLFEFEIIRWDSNDVIAPKWDTFEITTPSVTEHP